MNMPTEMRNLIGMDGIEFVEFASPDPSSLEKLFQGFGFSKTSYNPKTGALLYVQHDIHFIINSAKGTAAQKFAERHGPSISSMGWRFTDAAKAFALAEKRGAKVCAATDYTTKSRKYLPAVYGIGDSLIYFVENSARHDLYGEMGFIPADEPVLVPEKGFLALDHLTNNVEKGEMKKWAEFYKSIFEFTEVRYFDIRGAKTGLTSYALRSPCGKFCIPINEGTEDKSQINEYLREYKGPGIQHLAFLTEDILSSLKALRGTNIDTLDIDDLYYQEVFDRVPNVTEDRRALRDFNVLIDGDQDGYLLQIFTKNVVGPIFIEIIQRKNHLSFGEGNFGALFRSIEKDQERRGVI